MSRLLATALCDVAGGVLVLAGLIKLLQPDPWVRTIAGFGLSLRGRRRGVVTTLARLVGAAEIAVALAAVLLGGRLPLLVLALTYTTFTGVSVVARSRGSASCGCFGERSAPLGSVHILIDVAFALGAVVAAGLSAPSLPARLDGAVVESVVYLAFLGLGIAATVIAMTTGAEVVALLRPRSVGSPEAAR